MDRLLDHERLEVYQLSREFSREVRRLVRKVPPAGAESVENLLRAAKSVTRNIAESTGKVTPADKAKFVAISRGSMTEASASLDELVDFGFLEERDIRRGKDLAWRVVSMLVGLLGSLDEAARAAPRSKSTGPFHRRSAREREREPERARHSEV